MAARHPERLVSFDTSSDATNPKDEWEEWEDDDIVSEFDQNEDLDDFSSDVTQPTNNRSTAQSAAQSSNRTTQHRYSVQKPTRLKSRGRQRAQNAKAGIKVVTDMSKFRPQPPPPQQIKPAANKAHDETNTGNFVNAAALLALEGEPTSASVGSFSWLKRRPGISRSKRTAKKPVPEPSDLSPNARPIVIGISVPSDDVDEHQVSPYTAVIETPMDVRNFSRRPDPNANNRTPSTPDPPLLSVWSPDTEATESPYRTPRAASSIYSQATGFGGFEGVDVPPVPALPADLKPKPGVINTYSDDDGGGSPCTLFEEDGSPVTTRKSQKIKAPVLSPESASSRSNGWWDHVTTPFMQQNNPFKQQSQGPSPNSSTPTQEWWHGADEKNKSARASGLTIVNPVFLQQQNTASSIASTSQAGPSTRPETRSEKAQILLEENQIPTEEPPPYSPPKVAPQTQVKYAAVLPPSHIAHQQRVPSPGPMTPGLPGTMTSQGAIHMTDIPLGPELRTVPDAVLPDRAAGSYRTGDHFLDALGRANKSERQRRRHEKEDIVARKVGGFWRGRGIIPAEGCFGRTGREGRKRRRICMGIFGGLIAAIILAVVLAVVLTRRTLVQPVAVASIFLNLTDFPPMPTGVVTITGPDNSASVSGCVGDTAPSTAWSCSLPKEQHDPASSFAANQPQFIFQIQFDNNTRALWNVTDEDGNTLINPEFKPNPEPPALKEIIFLGNTTDHIEADEKAGEPTPFYISLLKTVKDPVGADALTRRQKDDELTAGVNLTDILPPPELNPDGTAAAARLFPLPVQQPIRLFDRGLPTEHYGFYTFFDKKIYLASRNKTEPADEDGGSPISNATSLVYFPQTRFLVKIWTRAENDTQLLGNGTDPQQQQQQSRAMPYPVTITEDMHGGISSKKVNFVYGVDGETQTVNVTDVKLIVADAGFGGTLVNPKDPDPDMSLGGVDGGTGGCRCEWVNYKGLTKFPPNE